MAPLRYAAKGPFLSLDCAPTPSTLVQCKERKGSNFAIWQPCAQLPPPGQTCFAAGWGNTMENRDPSEGLREVEIPIMESCKREYNDIARQICAGRPEGGADACQGKR